MKQHFKRLRDACAPGWHDVGDHREIVIQMSGTWIIASKVIQIWIWSIFGPIITSPLRGASKWEIALIGWLMLIGVPVWRVAKGTVDVIRRPMLIVTDQPPWGEHRSVEEVAEGKPIEIRHRGSWKPDAHVHRLADLAVPVVTLPQRPAPMAWLLDRLGFGDISFPMPDGVIPGPRMAMVAAARVKWQYLKSPTSVDFDAELHNLLAREGGKKPI